MNELKPEDVMRALECCDKGSSCFCDCDNCPYYGCDVPCKDKLHRDALALLREKDEEIERLKKELDDARRDCAVAEQNHYECKKELETARSEAITEFAERLKKTLIASGIYPVIVKNSIEKIAKELKGETDGKSDL